MSEYATSARFNLVPVTEEVNEDFIDDSDSGIDEDKMKDAMVATPKSQVEVTKQKKSPKNDRRPQDDNNLPYGDKDLEYEEIIQFMKDDDDISYDDKRNEEDNEIFLHGDLERLVSDDSTSLHLSSSTEVNRSYSTLAKVRFTINHL